jgi:hypothetical protein
MFLDSIRQGYFLDPAEGSRFSINPCINPCVILDALWSEGSVYINTADETAGSYPFDNCNDLFKH